MSIHTHLRFPRKCLLHPYKKKPLSYYLLMKTFSQEVGRNRKAEEPNPAYQSQRCGACSAEQWLMQHEQSWASKQKRPGLVREEPESHRWIARAWPKYLGQKAKSKATYLVSTMNPTMLLGSAGYSISVLVNTDCYLSREEVNGIVYSRFITVSSLRIMCINDQIISVYIIQITIEWLQALKRSLSVWHT